MKILGKIKNKVNKKLLIIISIIMILLILLSLIMRNVIIKNIENKRYAEELSNFSYEVKLFTLNEDYTYTFDVLVIVQEIDGIESIKYLENDKEFEILGKGKQKIALDFSAIENVDYEFRIKPIGKEEKTETMKILRKSSGADTYKLVKGVYVNTPFIDDFNSKYTRYLSVASDTVLAPANWIYDEEPSDWYDYKNRKWANIYVEVEGIDSYYVWIPRYVYKLDQDAQRSDVKFVDVYNNYIDAETGEVTKYKELLEQGYKLPEAFDFGENMGITSLSGYWISKYRLSELSEFKIDYNMAASESSITVSNFRNNVSSKAKTYTYAINGKIKNTSETLDNYTFTGLIQNENYIVNVTALDVDGNIVGSMTKFIEPTEVNPPSLDGFDVDTTFYVYWDENGIEHNEIPISQPAPENWYNYTYSEWANIVVRNDGLESYYVWIPRYQYILNQTSQRSDVKFILGTGGATYAGYQVPDAFWWDKNDNKTEDEGEQLTGYWISKYRLSREESEARITAEIAPGSDCIHIKDITGTLITSDLKYEYYLNGEYKYTGTSSTEKYTYTGLNIDTTYIINIIARNASTNAYVGAITKKVTTKAANEPDLQYFRTTEGIKDRTYYVIYNEENISSYIPISESAPNNWYDYSKSRWANIVITDGVVSGNTITGATATSYYVWIPRYEYKILSSLNDWSNASTSNARTDVKFLTGTYNTPDVGFNIPDAFWWDKNDNKTEDEGEQLTGYWISKYRLSGN